MPITREQRKMIDQLKRKIKLLERKEKEARKKLEAATKHARKHARQVKSQLEGKMRELKKQHVLDKAKACAKAAYDVECKVLKDVEHLGKELASAVISMDKKRLTRLAKKVAMKKPSLRKAASSTKSAVRAKVAKKKRKVAKLKRRVTTVRKAKRSIK